MSRIEGLGDLPTSTASRQGHRLATIAAAVLVALAGSVLATAPSASATTRTANTSGTVTPADGLWEQESCENPDQSKAPALGWASGSVGSHIPAGSQDIPTCSPSTPMEAYLTTNGTTDTAGGDNGPSGGSSVEDTYTPPAGSTIDGATLTIPAETADGYGTSPGQGAYAVVASPALKYDGADLQSQCVHTVNTPPGTGCTNSTSFSSSNTTVTIPRGLGGTISIAAECNGCSEVYGGDSHYSLVSMSSASITLDNSDTPTASGFSGTLLGTSSAPASGNDASLSFSASVAGGPGIYSVLVTLGGRVLYQGTPDTNNQECVPVGTDATNGALQFDYPQPCKQAVNVAITADTTPFTNGTYDLREVTTTAAGVASTTDQSIVIDNVPPNSSVPVESTPTTPTPAPTTTTTTTTTTPAAPGGAGGAGGAGGSGGASGTTRSTEVPPAIAPGGALARLTAHIQRRLWTRSAIKLTGAVVTSTDAPAANSKVVVSRSAFTGGPTHYIATVYTDGAGRFTVRVPRGNSRELHITVGHGSTVTIKELVTPNLSLRRVVVHGRTVAFYGRVRVSGKVKPVLTIQAMRPHVGWVTVGGSFTPGRNGRFIYTFTSPSPLNAQTYKLRVVTAVTGRWTAARSRIRIARV